MPRFANVRSAPRPVMCFSRTSTGTRGDPAMSVTVRLSMRGTAVLLSGCPRTITTTSVIAAADARPAKVRCGFLRLVMVRTGLRSGAVAGRGGGFGGVRVGGQDAPPGTIERVQFLVAAAYLHDHPGGALRRDVSQPAGSVGW